VTADQAVQSLEDLDVALDQVLREIRYSDFISLAGVDALHCAINDISVATRLIARKLVIEAEDAYNRGVQDERSRSKSRPGDGDMGG